MVNATTLDAQTLLAAETQGTTCFHCDLPVPDDTNYAVAISGRQRRMCCPGCQAVAQAIMDGGYEDYYLRRSEKAKNPSDLLPEHLTNLAIYDLPAVQKSFVRELESEQREASLILEGITCAACSWLNERHLRSLTGILQAQVNYSTHRARVVWDPGQIQLSDILAAIQRIGYVAHPYNPERLEHIVEKERKELLKRIVLTAALGMQLMMITAALYFSKASGMSWTYENFFRWVSLLLTTPIVLYAAAPFFINAWHGLKHAQPSMDVPVALGIFIAFTGSAWATWAGNGPVYFESVAMFTFFLLTARYFELKARQRSTRQVDAMIRTMPDVAERLSANGETQTVLASELERGNRVRVYPGAQVPGDGLVVDGASSVSETLLTGESKPIAKTLGDPVLAGSINADQLLDIEITSVREETVLSQIVRLVDRAQSTKPRLTRIADRTAAGFVVVVLCLALSVGIYWWLHDPHQWLPVTISTLVITCPCALSLATPTVHTAASNVLIGFGMIATGPDAVEQLARVDCLVFDKTGTLSVGEMRLTDVRILSELNRSEILSIAAALELYSQHPLAKAVVSSAKGLPVKQADSVAAEPGGGISGVVDGKRYYLGQSEYIHNHTSFRHYPSLPGEMTVVLLADATGVHAELLFNDQLRPDAAKTTSAFTQDNVRLALYSGDSAGAVKKAARELKVPELAWGLTPAQKLSKVQDMQADGFTVAMVGDGINDTPVLAASQVSIAMGKGADLARTTADFILVNNRLYALYQARDLSKRAMTIMRQNFAWAIGYNLLALPAAVIGIVPPWLAALGMSGSSLLVVGNALRLLRYRTRRATV